MSAITAEFDTASYDAQIKAWLKEGFAEEDILAQASHTWPTLPAGYTQATIRHLQCRAGKKKYEPTQGLLKIHHKRNRHLLIIEARLKEPNAPISLHSLYRGLLRDHEAACHKMLEVQERRPKRSSTEPNWSKIVKRQSRTANRLKQREEAILAQLEQQQPAKEATASMTRSSFASSIAGLIFFLLSLLVAGASSCTRNTLTSQYCVARPFPIRGSEHVHRQRASQLFSAPAEDHQAVLQRAADDSARKVGSACGRSLSRFG